jgi:hypothetical protein
MNRLEKCELAIELGYRYDPETGKVFGIRGKEIINKSKKGYITITNSKFQLRTHQFAWYYVHKEIVEEIDHINGIRDDNRICNLRAVSRQQNNWNLTKAKGYSWDKNNNKWLSQLRLNGKSIHLGRFDTEDEARKAYLIAKEKYHIIKLVV